MEEPRETKKLPDKKGGPITVRLADGSIKKCLNLGDALRDLVVELQKRHEWSENQVAKYIGIPQQTLNTFTSQGTGMTMGTFSKMLDASVAWELISWIREHVEDAALREEARLAALPRGTKKRGRPRK